ncbi:DNA polymerase I [Geothermobacter ehrlichii]|uniref:DNA polymerase I n=1 Tax=Geothermobacter ehrlichii TaxID=213224 RepID=A0A5D3WL52_9BACT|nr:DNA polymerase I [Geothermobacter ehrlichii]TYO97567.1 DNA polymerase I [Geothermobacter ehrlichii]
MERPRLFLIDGSSYIYRAYYAIRHLSNSRGMATNAIYGFTQMLLKVLRQYRPDAVAVVFDSKGPTFRKEIYPDYKANRAAMPEDLVPQIPVIKQVVRAFNLPALEREGYEADDIIATLARRAEASGMDVTVVTGDKDLMQIVSEHVRLLDTMKDQVYGPKEVAERFGGPDRVIEVQALAGDSSDNVPGVPGIGEKTAKQLIDEYGSLENLLANLDRIRQPKRRANLEQYAELARLSRRLVALVDDLELDVDPAELRLPEPDREALEQLFLECEFHQLRQELAGERQQERGEYRAVLDKAALDELVERLRQAERFCFDTETTGLDPLRAELVGLSFAVEPGRAWYLPLGHAYLGAPKQLDRRLVLDRLAPLFADPAIGKIAQNAKFDELVLRRAGLRLEGLVFDPMIASYLARPASRSHGMDAMAAELLGYRPISFEEVCGKGKSRISFAEVEVERATDYAAEDADITLRLADRLEPMLKETSQEKLFYEVELPLERLLAEMEWTGVRIDADFLAGLSEEFSARLRQLEDEIFTLAGTRFNVASPKQLGEVLFERMKLPRGKKTKTGWSTDVEVLTRLAEEHPVARLVLDHRSLSKLKGTYTDALPKLVHPETGRIHTSFNQTVTATGRLSSSDPNLQNIPIRTEEGRRIRESFVPDEGWLLLSADYSQIELRLLAHMADETTLKEHFRSGEDIHRRTAAEVFGVFPEMVTDEMRRSAKAINFGVIYGISAFGLAKQLGISRGEAQTYIDGYFARYPKIRAFMERCIAEAKEQKYVTTLLGRRCAVPDIDSRNANVRGYAERNAINYPVQGSAADLIKLAMLRVRRRLASGKLRSRMVLQVHDELVFEVPENEVETMRQLVREEMELAIELDLPLVVDVGVGTNWSQAH